MRRRLLFFCIARLVTGAFVLVPVVLWSLWAGPQVVPALLLGGAAGIAITVLGAGQLGSFVTRASGARVARGNSVITEELTRRRTHWLMVLANVPFFSAALAYVFLSDRQPSGLNLFTYVPPLLFAGAHAASISASVGYLQAARALAQVR